MASLVRKTESKEHGLCPAVDCRRPLPEKPFRNSNGYFYCSEFCSRFDNDEPYTVKMLDEYNRQHRITEITSEAGRCQQAA